MKTCLSRILPALFLLCFFIAAVFGCSSFNSYQKTGELKLDCLETPVTVIRDEKGMAYIFAENLDDALAAHGFVTAQDRLFQMELTRLFAEGRISELAGGQAVPLDTRMRTLGFHRNARKHVELLDETSRHFFQRYLDGVNSFIANHPDSLPLEFKLAGIEPSPWNIEDSLAVMYLMSWESAANMTDEIIALMLVEKLGPEKAREIFPLTVNPDDETDGRRSGYSAVDPPGITISRDPLLAAYLENGRMRIGSNNWTVGPRHSPHGKPIVANDPHLDATILPGPWYPVGIITPELRVVGVGIPGMPGIVAGRTEHVAFGITNSYGDAQDLYIETVDPDDPSHFLEGKRSIPFTEIKEFLKIKDKKAEGGIRREEITIRMTSRGPVVSGVLPGLKTDTVVSMRWSPYETMDHDFGFDKLYTAKNVHDIREAIRGVNFIMLNFVFADTAGNIGWQTSGKLPIRSSGNGITPFPVTDDTDNWTGWIPFSEMPQSYNPERGWLGTCNHLTVSSDYPHYYTSHVSPSYRYRRLSELLNEPATKTVDDHWSIQRDRKNLMAERIVPVMASALAGRDDTADMADILDDWDYYDDPASAAPTVFQDVYRRFAFLVFADELGDDLAVAMLKNWYFWQERLMEMVLDSSSPWFDDISTPEVKESRDDLFVKAAVLARNELEQEIGSNPEKWHWGKAHRLTLVSPIRRSGFGSRFLGAGSHPMGGSGETLYRAIYDYDDPFDVTVSASLRMVADLGDEDKVAAVLPGGVSARLFDRHRDDQVESFMSGAKHYWWFSDDAIHRHGKTTLTLAP
ncbi:MAG TPA: penicillin acylase family protein [Deltaproteobacteria bacterium]|nr:penicillin acylase family protein [Deltaproteobacteria bacterium]